MKGASLGVAAVAALALAVAQVASGGLVAIGVALAGLAAVGAGLLLRTRREASPTGPLVAAAGLALLALWPTEWGASTAAAWALGAACAAGLLSVAPSGPAQRERLPAGAWVGANLVGLLAAGLLLALFVAAPLAVRALGGPALEHGVEWRMPYGPLLAAIPVLALAGAGLLAVKLIRSRHDPEPDEMAAAEGNVIESFESMEPLPQEEPAA